MYKTSTVIATVLALATGVAYAQEDNAEGLYLGVGFGDYSAEIDEIDNIDIDDAIPDFDEDESSARYFAGWRFNRFLGVQLDYYDFGDSDTALSELPVAVETSGIAPSIVGTLPLGPVELFARAGIVYFDLELDLDVDNVIDESDNDPVYAAGVGLTVFERLNLQLEYEVIDIEVLDEAEAAWFNLSWRF